MYSILLMAPASGAGQDNGLLNILFMVAVIFVFYFFMIRPQMKKQKEIRKFRESLKKGDKIITTGGIYGKVNDIKEDVFIIEIAPNTTVKVDKNAVVRDMADVEVKK